jgi:hypothetical protein
MPNTTVGDLLTLAMKDIGYLAANETASAGDLADAFATFKQMLGQWQIDGLMVYANAQVSFPLTGALSYAIGEGATVDAPRPSDVAFAFWRYGGHDYPLAVLQSDEEYQAICSKSLTSQPDAVRYSPTYPSGTLYVWPVATTGEIHLTVKLPQTQFTSVTNELGMPLEYEFAVRFSLAEVLAATFSMALRSDVAALARKARRILKRNNLAIPQLGMPGALVRQGFNIAAGE